MRIHRTQRANSSTFLILFGFIFAAAGICAGAFFGQTSTLDCRRLESTVVDCRLQRDLLGMPVSETEIGQLESAWVDVSSDSEGDTYRVVLQGPNGETPLTSFYSSSRPGKDETVEAINRFIGNAAETSLKIEQSEWWIFVLTAFFVGIGFLAAAWGVLRAVFGLLRR